MRLRAPDPDLSDGVISLRAWCKNDLGTVECAATDSYIAETTAIPAPFSRDAGIAWIERQQGREEAGDGLSLAVSDVRDEALGAVVLSLERPGVAALGYWVVPCARRRGLAGRAVGLLSRWGIAAGGLDRIEACVEHWNSASQRILERAGFERGDGLGRHALIGGRAADVAVYVLGRQGIVAQ